MSEMRQAPGKKTETCPGLQLATDTRDARLRVREGRMSTRGLQEYHVATPRQGKGWDVSKKETVLLQGMFSDSVRQGDIQAAGSPLRIL